MEKELLQLEKYIDEIVGLMEDTADNTKLIKEIRTDIDSLKEDTTKTAKEFKAEILDIKELISKVKTIKGEDGKDGKDGNDGVDGKDGKDGLNGQNGLDGKDGTDGKDGSPDTPKDIKDKLETLKKDKRLDASAIKGIDERFKQTQKDWSDAINRIMLVATGGNNSTGTGTVTGTGVANQVAYWDGTSSLTGSANLTFDGTNLTLAKNLALPTFSTGVSSQGVIYRGAVSAANRFLHTYRAGSTTVENLFLGFGAGNFTLTGATAYNGGGNIGIGHSSLASITNGYSNLGIGLNALGLVTTGADNVALGQNSLAYLVGGVNCVGVGTRTGQYSTGSYNFFMGNDAGRGSAGSTTGTGNIYVGFQAGTAFTTASNNMVFGYQAGILLSSGGNNILIGASVAGTLTTGGSNIIIGKSSGVSSATVSNELNIGNAIYGTGMYGTASIGIGITPTNITARLHLPAGTATASTAPLKITSGGTLLTSAEDGAIETASDKIYFTIPTGTARKEFTLNDIALTSGRVPYATTNGRLTDSSALTYSGTGLTINGTFFSGDGGGFTGIYIGNDGSIADNNDQMWIGDDGSGNAVICADTSLRRVGMGTVVPSGLYGRLHIGAIDNSEIIFRLEGAGGGAGNPTENTHLSKGTTTNATATTIGTYSVSNGYCFQFDTRVVGHRTGGSAGAANDSASYWLRATFKYTGGAIVQIGTTDKLAHEDQAGWDANWVISGNDLLLQVTGATNNDVAWSSISRVMLLNT